MFTRFLGEKNRLKMTSYFVVFTIASIGTYRYDPNHKKSPLFEVLMIDVVGSIQKTLFNASREASGFIESYFYLVDVKKKNHLLQKEIAQVKNQLSQLEELKKENKRLKDLLKFKDKIGYKKILARVVAIDANRSMQIIRIDQGEKHGVKEKFPVLSNEGLVGYIYRTSHYFSDVITILDPNNRVDGILSRTRSHGVIEGYSSQKCIMKYVGRNDPISVGDQVVTAGLSNIYPKGVHIGKISKIKRESYGITQLIEITPSVDFNKIEEVIILKPKAVIQ